MKKNDIAKLKSRSAVELRKDAAEAREKIWNLRREIAGGKIKNVRLKRTMRRDVARLLTLAHLQETATAAKGLKKL